MNLSLNKLPPETIFEEIFKFLTLIDLLDAAKVSKAWQRHAETYLKDECFQKELGITKKQFLQTISDNTFGADLYQKLFGIKVQSPPKPIALAQTLLQPDPYEPNKKIYETHAQVLIINTETVTGETANFFLSNRWKLDSFAIKPLEDDSVQVFMSLENLSTLSLYHLRQQGIKFPPEQTGILNLAPLADVPKNAMYWQAITTKDKYTRIDLASYWSLQRKCVVEENQNYLHQETNIAAKDLKTVSFVDRVFGELLSYLRSNSALGKCEHPIRTPASAVNEPQIRLVTLHWTSTHYRTGINRITHPPRLNCCASSPDHNPGVAVEIPFRITMDIAPV